MKRKVSLILSFLLIFNTLGITAMAATPNSGDINYVIKAEGSEVGVLDSPDDIDSIDEGYFDNTKAEGDGIWDGNSTESVLDGLGTEEEPYLIETAAQLAGLNDFTEGGYFKLATNIDLGDYEWTPITLFEDELLGFDGAKHTISGLKITDDGTLEDYLGLFSEIVNEDKDKEVKVKDLQIVISEISTETASYVGGLAGYTEGISLENIAVTGGNITSSYDEEPYVGGIIGYINSQEQPAVIESCFVTTAITAKCAGGLIGSVNSDGESGFLVEIKNSYMAGDMFIQSMSGGIVGYAVYVDVDHVYVSGTIYLDAREDDIKFESVGGIFGYWNGSDIEEDAETSIKQAHVLKPIQLDNDANKEGISMESVGGLIGNLEASGIVYIEECTTVGIDFENGAQADTFMRIGGLIGSCDLYVDEDEGPMLSSIKDCLVEGDIIIASEESEIRNIGGFVGQAGNGCPMEKCSFWGKIDLFGDEVKLVGGLFGKTSHRKIADSIVEGNIEIESPDVGQIGNFMGEMNRANTESSLEKLYAHGNIKITSASSDDEFCVSEVSGIFATYDAETPIAVELTDVIIVGDIELTAKNIEDELEIDSISGMANCGEGQTSFHSSGRVGDITLEFTGEEIEINDIAGFCLINDCAIFTDCFYEGDIKFVLNDSLDSVDYCINDIFGLVNMLQSESIVNNLIRNGDILLEELGSSGGVISNVSGGIGMIEELDDSLKINGLKISGDIKIKGTNVSLEEQISGAIGYFETSPDESILENSFYMGLIDINLDGDSDIDTQFGGLIGELEGEGLDIRNCFSSGKINVICSDSSDCYLAIGGLIGSLDRGEEDGISITNSYSTMDITLDTQAESGDKRMIGGFVGKCEGTLSLESVYYAGKVECTDAESYRGDLFGWINLESFDFENAKNVYYDSDKTCGRLIGGYDESDDPEEQEKQKAEIKELEARANRTTREMTRENADASEPHLGDSGRAMTEFDFEDVWVWYPNDEGTGYYPQLIVFEEEEDNPFFTLEPELSLKSVETKAYYHVHFLANGGEDANADIEHKEWCEYGGNVVTEPGYRKDSKDLESWNTKANDTGDTVRLQNVSPVTQDYKLYAIYPSESGNGGNGGSSSSGSATLIKVDEQDQDTTLSGARFTLYRKNTTGEDTVVKTYTTDKNGKITATGLKAGEYYWVETIAPVSYVIDDSEHEFKLYSGSSKNIMTVTNAKAEVPEMMTTDNHYAYIVGYPSGEVKPGANITRAEIASILVRLVSDEVRAESLTKVNSFSDVDASDWFNTAVSTAVELKLMDGRQNGTFEPNAFITRAELTVAVARASNQRVKVNAPFTDINGHWAQNEINIAVQNGWISGYEDNTFKPDSYITRAEAAAIINRMLQRMPETNEDLAAGMIKWIDNSDTNAWYYIAIQEATNSHDFTRKENGYETWTILTQNRDWTLAFQ